MSAFKNCLCNFRYACLIEPLLPQITKCLKETNMLVRENTYILLIRLLQEDYLKLKGTFFFRILEGKGRNTYYLLLVHDTIA